VIAVELVRRDQQMEITTQLGQWPAR